MYNKNVRYFTLLLLLCLTVGFLVSLVPVSAAPVVSPFDDEAKALETEDRIALYLDEANAFTSSKDKISTMKKKITRGDYSLYVDESTGEVGVMNNVSGQILLTNPYDLATTASIDVKKELMSQVVIKFEDLANSGVTRTFYSYTESAARGQIEVKNIKNGIRVEYTLGKQTARRLIPRWMEKSRFEHLLYDYIQNECPVDSQGQPYDAIKFKAFYSIRNTNDDQGLPETVIKEYNTKYPCTKKKYTGEFEDYGEYMAIYVIDSQIVEREENLIEGYIKQYCPHYNYEQLEYDHDLTGYVGADKSPAIFRLAIEYYLDEEGLKVTVPANSIRFDEDYYRLTSISILQYFGASSNDYTGYTFIPDGSGAIIRNEEIMNDGKNTYTISGQIYGADFAYHELTGINGKSEIMREPVYGVIQDTETIKYNFDNIVGFIFQNEDVVDENGEPVLYTSEDRIMVDAYDSDGYLILSEQDYWSKYQYAKKEDGTYSVITEKNTAWNTSSYSVIASVEEYNVLRDAGLVPYYETVNYYLMSPLVKTKKYSDKDIELNKMYGIPLDFSDFDPVVTPITNLPKNSAGDYTDNFDYITYKGEKVFVYVNALGEQVSEDERVEGVLKIVEQLYYNGQPAYYNTDVPVDPSSVTTVTTAAPETPDTPVEEPTEGEEVEEEAEEAAVTTAATEPPDTPIEEPEEGEEEPTEEIKRYNDVQKTTEKHDIVAYEEISTVVSEGYVAILTEGAALAQFTSSHGAKNPAEATSAGLHKYNSVYTTFFPRPQDSYRLSDAISVGSSDVWTVVSDRKYTGNYTILFRMLSDAVYQVEDESGKTVDSNFRYKASYVGMANAYRDYLISTGVLTPLNTIEDDIPLYLELLGMTSVKETVLTIPVMMDKALTSFNDIKAIYEDLSKDGIDNVRARLTGFTKNGMSQLAPSGLKFEKVVGGNKGYKSMVTYTKDHTSSDGKTSLTIYPDFDFVNLSSTGLFDGVSYLNDTVRTIDDRYANKRTYDATYQSFQRVGSVCVAPEAYQKIYSKFAKKLNKLGDVSGISVSTLGTDLNSDFDEDDPYNREDTMELTVDLLKSLYEEYGKVMIDGGNAYALAYASDILYMSLDSSRYMRASASIPFMGIVLHGYVNYAGDPTNVASDIYYEQLKIIENGASPYFILAYENTSAIKESYSLSKYYAIDYSIWYKDIVAIYQRLNNALKDCQNSMITDHSYVTGTRSLTEKESEKLSTVIEKAKFDYETVLAEARKSYENRKAIAERHGNEFTEVFEETYDYLKDQNSYAQYKEEEFLSRINREITGTTLVSLTYTAKDNSSRTFILNYNDEEVTVTYEGVDYIIGGTDFVMIDRDASGNIVSPKKD